MSIVFSAIVPHSPVLIPSIGKDNLERINKTEKSFNELEENIYASQAETIIIISPHGPIQSNTFAINLSPEFDINFEEFGDFSTKTKIAGDVGLSYKIREKMEVDVPLQLISESKLDHGTAIPLFLLSRHLPNIKVIPIYYSGLDLESHFKFGQLLKQEILASEKRIAVIASGDLSHSLTKDSPAGYSPKGKKFDNRLIDSLIKKEVEDIVSMKEELYTSANECGLKSIVTLLGIMDGLDYKPNLLSYEFPFGVGYLAMNFKF